MLCAPSCLFFFFFLSVVSWTARRASSLAFLCLWCQFILLPFLLCIPLSTPLRWQVVCSAWSLNGITHTKQTCVAPNSATPGRTLHVVRMGAHVSALGNPLCFCLTVRPEYWHTHTHSCTCITYRSVIYITLSAINWLYNLKRTLNKVCISFQLLKSTVLIQISHHTVLLAWIQILTERKKPQCQQYVCNKRQRTGLTVNHLYLCWCAFTVLFLFFQLCVCLSQVLFGV